ncbi:MAG: histidine kinase [Bacteroidetes bacterium]|nr:MAG: histidine kinase [Bacteroidota bacterium]
MGTVFHILKRKGHDVFSVRPEISVYDGLELLVEKRIGCLMVTDETGKYLGTFTERDYARKVILKGRSSKETLVSEIMDPHPSVSENSTIEECMEKMSTKGYRHLPVMDGAGNLVGVVSISDVVKYIIDEQKFLLEHMGDYISGTHR